MRWKLLSLSCYPKVSRNLRCHCSRLRPLGLVILLSCLPFVFHWRLFSLRATDRAFVKEGDFSSQYFPLRAYAAELIAQGKVPLWNPYLFGGQPGLADIQMAALYPPSFVGAHAVSGHLTLWHLQLQTVAHISLAALGTFFLAKKLSGSTAGGCVSALAFTLGGYLTSFPVQQPTILATVSWLPWLLLTIEHLATELHALGRKVAALAVLFSMTVLAGHPQTAMLVAYVTVAYTVFRLAFAHHRKHRAFLALTGMLLGSGMAACQLLPTLSFIARSTRATMSYENVSRGFGLHETMAILYPGYFGGTPQYVGIVTLVLAGIAVVYVPWRRIVFWAATAATGLILSFGSNTALFPTAYVLLPGFGTSRNQERAILYFAFGTAMLSSFGVAWLLDANGRARRLPVQRWLARAAAAAVLFGVVLLAGTRLPPPDSGINLFGGILKQHFWIALSLSFMTLLLHWHRMRALGSTALVTLLIALLGLNLASVNWLFNLGPQPDAGGSYTSQVSLLIQERLNPGCRVASGGLLPEGPSAGLLYRLRDTTGNTPLRLAAYGQFEARVPEWRRWQLLAVQFVLLPEDARPGDGLVLVHSGALSLYEVSQPAEPIRLIHEIIPPAAHDIWTTLASPDFDPTRQAVAETDQQLALSPPSGEEYTKILSWQPGLVQAFAQATSPALAVFSIVADPGWKVYVNGSPAQWVTANGLFVGVPLCPGRNEIRLSYMPSSFSAGAALTGLSLFLTAFLIALPHVTAPRGAP